MKTVLAIGAHYDDCVFGVPGIMLQAVRKNHRVVILTLIGDYTNWPPIGDRGQELIQGAKAISGEYGVEMRYLDFKSHQFEYTAETKRKVSEAVADIAPEVAFLLWRDDHHDDHVVASQLSRTALRNAGAILDRRDVKGVRDLYYYDNGPGHTIGYEPNTYVDISDEWSDARDWLGKFMALVRGQPYDRARPEPAQEAKEILARYRGRACGAKYAEAVQRINRRTVDIL